jgi:hypothetical protein
MLENIFDIFSDSFLLKQVYPLDKWNKW